MFRKGPGALFFSSLHRLLYVSLCAALLMSCANAEAAAGYQSWIDPRAYGATCNGVTDDTAGLQAAINVADTLTGGGAVYIPGVCKISSSLTVPTTSGGFAIYGDSPGHSAIVQNTSNIPVIEVTASLLHHLTVRDLMIGHATAQPEINTNAIGIEVGTDSGGNPTVYLSTFRNLVFYNSFRGIQESNNGTVWGSSFDQITGGESLSGATLWFNPSVTGSVRNSFTHIYNSQAVSEPQVFLYQCYGCTVTDLESNNGRNTVFEFGAFEGSLRDVNIESVTLNTANAAMIQCLTCEIDWSGLWLQGNNMVNVGGGNSAFVIQDTNASSRIKLDRVHINSQIMTSGTLYLTRTAFAPAPGQALWDIGQIVVLPPGVSIAFGN